MSGAPSANPRPNRFALRPGKPRKASPPLIQIDPADLDKEPLTYWQQIRRGIWTILSGYGVSVGVHFVILFFLALIAIRQTERYNPPGLEVGWIGGDPHGDPRASTRELAPVKIEAVKIESSGGKAKTEAPAEDGDGGAPQGNRPGAGAVAVKAVGVGGMLGGRSERVRGGLLAKAGNNSGVERSINLGLMWLARQQQAAGNWQLHEGYPDAGYRSLRTDTGATALALLPFLGTGNTHLGGTHADVVKKGIQWLKGIQKSNGDFHDHEELGRQTAFYAHAQATIVLCEALALTKDDSLRDSAERGVQYLLAAQQPTLGGWKYQPQNDKTVGDLSVTGWALMALHTARAAGIEVSEDAYIRANGFLDSVSSHQGARYRYEPTHPADDFTAAMTAEGLVCRQFLGWPKDHPAMVDGLNWLMLRENLPEWSPGRRNVYAWYYVGHALHNVGGDDWKSWYTKASNEIVRHQAATGSNKPGQDIRGSWSPKNPSGDNYEYGDKAGRLYVTAMSLLVLEMPFRHLPVYKDAAAE